MTLQADSWRAKVYAPVTGAAQRSKPTRRQRDAITEKQNGCCLYCGLVIGATVRRRGKPVVIRPQYDHFVPYSYSRANPSSGWTLACHVCNGIKGSRIYATVLEAQEYIRQRWAALGYELPITGPAVSGERFMTEVVEPDGD
jgi:5-methylcytosine-specific restriction endonuclease McrA